VYLRDSTNPDWLVINERFDTGIGFTSDAKGQLLGCTFSEPSPHPPFYSPRWPKSNQPRSTWDAHHTHSPKLGSELQPPYQVLLGYFQPLALHPAPRETTDAVRNPGDCPLGEGVGYLKGVLMRHPAIWRCILVVMFVGS